MIYVIFFFSKGSGIKKCFTFSKKFRHCAVAQMNKDHAIFYDFDESGIVGRTIVCDGVNDLVRKITKLKSCTAYAMVHVSHRYKPMWRPFAWRSCNEAVRFISSIACGWTFNPRHLFNKLKDKGFGENYLVSRCVEVLNERNS